VLCALGDATTRMRTETARSFSTLASRTTAEDLAGILTEMEGQICAELKEEGVEASEISVLFEVDIRYSGQAFEVPMEVTLAELADKGIQALTDRFDEEHRRLFTFNMDSEHEIVNLRAVALGQALDLPAAQLPEGNGDPVEARIRDHELYMDGRMQAAVIYDRARLKAKDVIKGPAIVIEMDSTTLVESDCIATVDAVGNILITPADAA
jgi:N-methylhydantoinase A